MVNVIISLLHMDDLPLNLTHCSSPKSYSGSPTTCIWEHPDLTASEGGNRIVISFMGLLLDTLRRNLSSTISDQENLNGSKSPAGRQALDWRISIAKRLIEDWEWRLSILQHLLPLYERQWRWREALMVLRAAPSKLLNL